MEGILLGMLIPLFAFTTVGKNVIIQKRLFDKGNTEILRHLATTLLKSGTIIVAVVFATTLLNTDSLLLNILLKGIVAVLISATMLVVMSFRNKYFKSIVDLMKNFVTAVACRKKV